MRGEARQAAWMRQLAAGQEHHRAGRLKEAERAYRDVLRRDRENPAALQMLGIIAAQTGRFTTAIDYFSRALVRGPNNGELHYNLAEAYRRVNDSERAYESFERAIALGVNFIEAYESCAAAARQAAIAAGRSAVSIPRDAWQAKRSRRFARRSSLMQRMPPSSRLMEICSRRSAG